MSRGAMSRDDIGLLCTSIVFGKGCGDLCLLCISCCFHCSSCQSAAAACCMLHASCRLRLLLLKINIGNDVSQAGRVPQPLHHPLMFSLLLPSPSLFVYHCLSFAYKSCKNVKQTKSRGKEKKNQPASG